MTRFIHDQFAKQYLTELLTPYGQVETSKDITAEVRQIDVLFIPSPHPTQSLETLGILGRMVTNYAIFEPEMLNGEVSLIKVLFDSELLAAALRYRSS